MDPKMSEEPSEAKNEQIALKSHGQRRISYLWETTQAVVAVMTAGTALGCCLWMIVSGEPGEKTAAFSLLSGLTTLVLNTYFIRTNHEKVGGPGGEQAGHR